MTSLPTDGYDRDSLVSFLNEYGAALGTGDIEAIGDRIGLPALVVTPESSLVVSEPEAFHAAFRDRLAAWGVPDLVAAVPELKDVQQVGWMALWVEVRWSYRDETANEAASELVRYLLRRARDTYEVCVIVPVLT
jgi:hypothetical protein